ncbi:unnamed protein product [Parnassius mnemosyne]|uniref:Transcription factor Adf-1 n=1 Tax=Parnassius mnemosyne TaxID=213953 RepID=A0AAV1L5G9_9NEOP
MSFEEIISEIQAKPEMWCSSHRLYKNRVVKAKVWRELSAKLKVKEEILRKRWKHLKDQYRKELKKYPGHISGIESDDWGSTWQYFNMMSFVKDELMHATGNLNVSQASNTQDSESTDTHSYLNDLDTEMIESVPYPLPQHSPVGSTSSQDSSRRRSNISQELLEIKRRKLSIMEKRFESDDTNSLNKDEDYLFFKSILPYMKKLTEVQKLHLRGKINDWLTEAITQNELSVKREPKYD